MAVSKPDERLMRFVIRALVLVLLQAALLRLLAGANVVSVALGAGEDTPLAVLAPAAVFLFLRVWVVLCLPGLLAYELVCWACARQLAPEPEGPTRRGIPL